MEDIKSHLGSRIVLGRFQKCFVKSQGGVGLYKQDPRGCVVLQLLFYSVYSYTACSEDLTDGICGRICQSHSNSFWGLWGPLQ